MKLQGVMPALVTPFDAAGKIDFAAFEKLLTNLREAGVSGWVPCGSSGEYNFMSDEERDSVLKFVKDFAKPGEILIAGTNAPSTAGVIANTLRAKEMGYDAVLLATPFYTKPTQAELIKHFQTVLEATDMPIVLYSYPDKDGIELGWEVLDALADDPRIIGIKESSGSLQRAIGIATRYKDRIQLVSGSDDIALDFMFWGADAWICGPANCMAKAVCDLDRTYRSGDLDKARAQMATLYTAMNILESGKFVQKLKYGCEIQGMPVGECRAPLGPLTDEEKADFRAAMEPILNW
ncbi:MULTISPECIES: 4-hydroxy-tetrahydrodipicolinate synthase [Paracoccus]|uniref:4-hydroxy-tetrahydrodipicolinate synthase n=1 Tax=Paracoccus pantotrophus TaxID=82367 RepID=A0A7H9BZU7_PARPN|nr:MULTISPECIES: 4-hydroxy-tetrahydrodipicolinate synthase [Paracoccus]MDF3854157.1 4-hydroxy-tetrahydrodipicolinate synthase [Paracoccus pantotrophus]QLH16897.1 4-hydroxy-tetrahydrodipicolinate synthase [Paracoccus pantotrophus]RNI14283.1 4-hydroxy-tetrahydrodipicolinate synthase [Paracoccus pantotrophus]UFM66613.1 4-hydroxy-tetrahydrodipicolinate synthase [Paracoccus sp. MA]SFO25809.1 4-hydroxy-tetrahydrodipicolinate synthase [Paracoccus pantotrophus]